MKTCIFTYTIEVFGGNMALLDGFLDLLLDIGMIAATR